MAVDLLSKTKAKRTTMNDNKKYSLREFKGATEAELAFMGGMPIDEIRIIFGAEYHMTREDKIAVFIGGTPKTLDPLNCRNKILVTRYNPDGSVKEQFECDRDDRKRWQGCGVHKHKTFKRKGERTSSQDEIAQCYPLMQKRVHQTKRRSAAIASFTE